MESDAEESGSLISARPRMNVEASFDDVDFNVRSGFDRTVVVGVESEDCFPVVFPRSEYRTLPKRSMLAYALEETLPFDGDDLSLDVIESGDGWLVISVHGADLSPQIDDLARDRAYVRAITPKLFLAWTRLITQHKLSQTAVVVWQSESGIDVVKIADGHPCKWCWIKRDADQLNLVANEFTNEAEATVLVVDGDQEMIESLGAEYDIETIELNRDRAAEEESHQISLGYHRPIVDLRTGLLQPDKPLHSIRHSLAAFGLMFVMMQALVVSAMGLRDYQYRQQTATFIQQQESAYASVFPDQPTPVGIVSRLESEHRRLAGTRGVSENLPKLKSVVPISHVLLSTLPLPTEARFQIEWLDFLPGRIEMTGAAKSYIDLETISNRMKVGGLDVPPVSANKTAEGVSLRFSGIQFHDAAEHDSTEGAK